jgi:hypothetical protein
MPFTPSIFSKLNPDQLYFVKNYYTKFHKYMTNSSVANTKSKMGIQGPHQRFFFLYFTFMVLCIIIVLWMMRMESIQKM